MPRFFGAMLLLFLVVVMGLCAFHKGMWPGLYWKLCRKESISLEHWSRLFVWLYNRKHVVLEGLFWLFLSPVLLVLGRVFLFTVTHHICSSGLWIFPNLLSDDGFFATFSPLYEWDHNPRNSLGLRWRQFRNRMRAEMGSEDKHRKNGKRKISPRALRKATMYRNEN